MEGGVGRWALAVVVEWALATDVAAGRGAAPLESLPPSSRGQRD
jgi:hypothetical protein